MKCIKCSKHILENQNGIGCDDCLGWLHLKCSGLTLKKFKELGKNEDTPFSCKWCLKYKCGKCEKPVLPSHNGILCDTDSCGTWFHLKCTRFTLKEYKDKKSRLHTENWHCPDCLCIPYSDLPQKEFVKLVNDDKRLKNYFNFITSNELYSKKCTVCDKEIRDSLVKKSFPCTSCKSYIHRKCTGIPLSEILLGTPSQFKYWNCKTCVSDHSPLADLDDSELSKLTFNSNYKCQCSDKSENISLDHCETFQLAKTYLPKDSPCLFGPDPNIDLTHDINSKCNYYSNHDFHKLTNKYKDKDKKPFTAIHTNIESLMHNFDSLEQLCIDLDYPFDIIAVTETWNPLKNKDKFIPKSMEGYEPYKGLSGTTTKSGCGLYIRTGLTFVERKDLDISHHDDLNEFQVKFVEIVMPKSANIIFSVTYRHPRKTSDSTYIDKLQDTLTKIAEEHKIIMAVGDFNYNLFNQDKDNQTRQFIETMFTSGLQPTINKPTRVVRGQKPSLIDNIFTNAIDKDITSGNLTHKITDHMPNFIVMKNVISDHKKLDRKIRLFKNIDLVSYQNDINSIDLTPVLHMEDVNEIYKYYHDQILKVIDKHAPYVTLTNKQLEWRKKPWINRELQKMISQKHKLYNKYLTKRKDVFWYNRYKTIKKSLEKEIFQAKKKILFEIL